MTITGASLNGYYKAVYGEKQRPIPNFGVMQRLVPFSQRAKIGDVYTEPVFTRRAHGVTFARTTARTAYSLAAARSIQSQKATMAGAEITLRESIATGALAASEGPDGKVSFGSAYDEAVLGIEESHRFYVEHNLLYGGGSIGTIESCTDATPGANDLTVIITKQTWAVGMWAQAENALVDCYTAVGGTKLNSRDICTVTSLADAANRTIVLTFANEADADDVLANGTNGSTTVIEFALADGETTDGVYKVLTNTGTLFGIDASVNGVWKANTIDAGNTKLTFSKCLAGQTAAVARGGMGPMTYLLNPLTWQDIAEDQAALRRYGEASRTMKNGAEAIEFSGSGGLITFEQHPMVKCGDAFGLQLKWWIRGGESDLVSGQMNGKGELEFFMPLVDNQGWQMRNFSSQFIYCRRPAAQTYIKNIVPTQLA